MQNIYISLYKLLPNGFYHSQPKNPHTADKWPQKSKNQKSSCVGKRLATKIKNTGSYITARYRFLQQLCYINLLTYLLTYIRYMQNIHITQTHTHHCHGLTLCTAMHGPPTVITVMEYLSQPTQVTNTSKTATTVTKDTEQIYICTKIYTAMYRSQITPSRSSACLSRFGLHVLGVAVLVCEQPSVWLAW